MFDPDTVNDISPAFRRTNQEHWGGIPESGASKSRLYEAEVRFYNEPTLTAYRDLQQFTHEYKESLAFEGKADKWNYDEQSVYEQRMSAADAIAAGKATEAQREMVVDDLSWMWNDIRPDGLDPEYFGKKVDPVRAQEGILNLQRSIDSKPQTGAK